MSTLQKRLKKQVTLMIWVLSLAIVLIASIIIIEVYAHTSGTYVSGSVPYWDYGNTDSIIEIFSFVILAAGIASFVLWIIGIVNAVKIDKLVNSQASMLVIFSIFTLVFVGFVTAIWARNKFTDIEIVEEPAKVVAPAKQETSKDVKLSNLKQAFMDGVITSKEYETKKTKIEKEN